MIADRVYAAHHGQYALILALLCMFLVFQLGIFEGLLITVAIHGIVNYIILNQKDKMPSTIIIKKYLEKFTNDGSLN